MKVAVITRHEKYDYVGFDNYFHPEACTDEKVAEDRLKQLNEELGEWSGLYYMVDTIELDSPHPSNE